MHSLSYFAFDIQHYACDIHSSGHVCYHSLSDFTTLFYYMNIAQYPLQIRGTLIIIFILFCFINIVTPKQSLKQFRH